MSTPPGRECGSTKEVQNAGLERDPDQDSLDTDSLGEGEDTLCSAQTAPSKSNL